MGAKNDRYETLRNEVEKIVRSEGDITLNIDKFIAKMMSEMEACITPGPYGLDLPPNAFPDLTEYRITLF